MATGWRKAARAALSKTILFVTALLGPGCGAPPEDDNQVASESAVVDFAIGDLHSDPETFTHPAWGGLDVHRARIVAPWDIAKRPLADKRRVKFTSWLAKAEALGVEPYVTLGPSDKHMANEKRFRAPTAAQYEDAFVALRNTWPQLKLLGPWNEPNYPNTLLVGGERLEDASCDKESLDHCGPMLVAFYYRLARKHCKGCVLVAGEFSGRPKDPYWNQYRKFLRKHRPTVWSVHPHHDANRFQASGKHCVKGDDKCTTRSFVKWLNGLDKSWDGSHVWLTEVGAYRRNADGKVFSEKSQRNATAFILRLPNISERITRIYYYNFQNACSPDKCPVQDRGLVSPAPDDPAAVPYDKLDKVRSSYAVIRDRDPSP